MRDVRVCLQLKCWSSRVVICSFLLWGCFPSCFDAQGCECAAFIPNLKASESEWFNQTRGFKCLYCMQIHPSWQISGSKTHRHWGALQKNSHQSYSYPIEAGHPGCHWSPSGLCRSRKWMWGSHSCDASDLCWWGDWGCSVSWCHQRLWFNKPASSFAQHQHHVSTPGSSPVQYLSSPSPLFDTGRWRDILLWRYYSGGPPRYGNAHPNAPSNRSRSLSALYKKHEDEKKRMYGQHVLEIKHGVFTPLILSTSGGMGREAQTSYKRLADFLSLNATSFPRSWVGWDASCPLQSSDLQSCAFEGGDPPCNMPSETAPT